jgi:hypothetical protein
MTRNANNNPTETPAVERGRGSLLVKVLAGILAVFGDRGRRRRPLARSEADKARADGERFGAAGRSWRKPRARPTCATSKPRFATGFESGRSA